MPSNYVATPVVSGDSMANLVSKLNAMMNPLQTLVSDIQTIDPSGIDMENVDSVVSAINSLHSALEAHVTDTATNFGLKDDDIAGLLGNLSLVSAEVNKLQEGLFYWLSPVANYAQIATTYPSPKQYSAVRTLDNMKTYRFEGTAWVERTASQVEGDLTKKGIVQLTNAISTSESLSATPKAVKTVDDKVVTLQDKTTALRSYKTSKDAEGIFTTVTYRRKTDGSLHSTSVLSGGTSPLYTTRTVTFYETDGVTVRNTVVYALTYDTDGVLISEV